MARPRFQPDAEQQRLLDEAEALRKASEEAIDAYRLKLREADAAGVPVRFLAAHFGDSPARVYADLGRPVR